MMAEDSEDPDSVDGELDVENQEEEADVPPHLISPAFTPPATPGTGTPRNLRVPISVRVEEGERPGRKQRLIERLPKVECVVRARIPT
jgi:GTP cyclohydrolase II